MGMEPYIDTEMEFGPLILVYEHEPFVLNRRFTALGSEGARTVMVLEDNPAVRGLNTLMLRGLGYRVVAASSPERAIPFFRCYPRTVDLIVCDVRLPKMSGPEVIGRLRQIRNGFQVLYVTGASDSELLEYDFENAPVLRKPYRVSHFKKAVRELLGESDHVPPQPESVPSSPGERSSGPFWRQGRQLLSET